MRKKTISHPSRTRKRIIATISLFVMLSMVFGLAISKTQAAITAYTVQSTESGAISDNVFGVEITPLDNNGGLNLIGQPQTQTKWVKGIDILWSEVETTAGFYDWSAINNAVIEYDNAVLAGLTPILVIRNAPEFARLISDKECGPINPVFYDDFGNFIVELINSPFNGKVIPYISIWNEPDIDPDYPDTFSGSFGGCWGDHDDPYYGGESYGEMLIAINTLFEEQVDFTTNIIAGELLLDCDPNNPPETFPESGEYKDCSSGLFLEGILRAGNGNYDYFDGISYHAYDYYQGVFGQYTNTNWHSSWDTTGPALNAKLQYVQDLLDEYGVNDKFVMNTEFALLCDDESEFCDDDHEDTKASYIAQAYSFALVNGLEANIWFDVTGTWGRNNGLLTRDGEILPAYRAYKFASEKLNGITGYREITQYEGVTGFEFWGAPCEGDKNCNVWILWSLDGNDHDISLPAVPYAIQDMFGYPDPDPISQTLTVSLAPIYIDLPTFRPRMSMPIIANCASFLNNLVGNGGFDCGMTPWHFYEDILPVTLIEPSPENPITGTPDTSIPLGKASALLGDTNLGCYDNDPNLRSTYAAVDQSVDIPNQSPINLYFSYIVYSQDDSYSGKYDRFEVYVNDELKYFDGNRETVDLACKWYRVPSDRNPGPNNETSGWAVGVINLDEYNGETITISFRNYLIETDENLLSWYNTYTYVDNVIIIAE